MKTFVKIKEFRGETPRTVTVYGELRERKIKGVRTKEFAMGWSICSQGDVFNRETGIKLAKSRLDWKKAITTTNGCYLCPDMCEAIVRNEVEYIGYNWEKKIARKPVNGTPAPVDNSKVYNHEDEVDSIVVTDDEKKNVLSFDEVSDCIEKAVTEALQQIEERKKPKHIHREWKSPDGNCKVSYTADINPDTDDAFDNIVKLLGIWL